VNRFNYWIGFGALLLVACSGDLEPLKPVDPVTSDFLAELDTHGIPTTRSRISSTGEDCLGEFRSALNVFYAESFRRIDLYAFDDETAASAVADEIPPDADCRNNVSISWVDELPYFQCGALIAFIQSGDDDLAEVFEQLCGPPFAKTFAQFPAATSTSLPDPTATQGPNPTPIPRVIAPAVQGFISILNSQGVPTRLTERMFADDNCMFEYESVLHGYNSGRGIEFGFGDRFDLYPFESEQFASAIASKIPPDAECRGGSRHVDSVYELPYFQCGELIAFVLSPNENLQSTFEDLCGPPFARKVARFPARN
jgi:hypothetical protein